jgi:UTP--glucose-1-phosphate uridylyltransferase
MDKRPTKAIIPVAGYGTRRLPLTKAIEKCMVPIGNRPIIDFVVADCIKAGITEIIFVVNEQSSQLRAYYDRNLALEKHLQEKGKADMVELIRPPEGVDFKYVVQPEGRYGTTVPVWLCREYINPDEPVLVIMGDQFFYREDGGSNLADLIDGVASKGATAGLLGVNVPREDVKKYGVIEQDSDGWYKRIIEHPDPENTPSTLNNASIYLFDPIMFKYIERDINSPHTGEYMIIDAINAYVEDGNKLVVGEAGGKYLDGGTVQGWLYANNYILERQTD